MDTIAKKGQIRYSKTMENKNSFCYKLRWNLIYRLITSVLVFVLPVCIVAVILTVMVMTRANRQIVNSYQLQLDRAMQQMEENMLSVDVNMDQFVYDYVSELNLADPKNREMTAYDMFADLKRTMENCGQAGFFSVFDKRADHILIQQQKISSSAAEIDELSRLIKKEIRTSVMKENYIPYTVKNHSFLVRNYVYSNYQIQFWFDLGANISQDLSVFYEGRKPSQVYVYQGSQVNEIMKEGMVQQGEKTWDSYLRTSFTARALTWKAEVLPVEVCVRLNIRSWQMIPGGYWLLFVVTLACLSMIFFLWKIMKLEVIIPIENLNKAMHELQQDHLDYRIHNRDKRNSDEIQYLYQTFDKMANDIQLSSEKDKQMYQTQMDNLRLQVNPHMLLNSFNTIYSLAQTKNYDCIQEYSLLLVDYFRYALRKNEDMVPLYQEIDFVKSYIEIQKIRFPKAFSWVYAVEEVCKNAMIPPLLIENFVENAMKYALKPGEVVEVLMNIRKEGNRLMISVCDTGRGMKPEILSKLRKGEPYIDRMGNKHIGIWNCIRRVELYYEEKAQINIISTFGEGTQVFMNIPFVEEKKVETINR